MTHLFTANVPGWSVLRVRLMCDRAIVPRSTTGDFTRFRLYLGTGSRRDQIGEWDSNRHAINEYDGFHLLSEETKVRKGQSLVVEAQRNGQEAPTLTGFSVQPDLQFRGA